MTFIRLKALQKEFNLPEYDFNLNVANLIIADLLRTMRRKETIYMVPSKILEIRTQIQLAQTFFDEEAHQCGCNRVTKNNFLLKKAKTKQQLLVLLERLDKYDRKV